MYVVWRYRADGKVRELPIGAEEDKGGGIFEGTEARRFTAEKKRCLDHYQTESH
jgi:hypothetical protein